MSLDNALLNLQTAFDAVAHEIKAQYPNMWDKTAQLYTDQNNIIDTDSAVLFLTAENYAGWGGKRLIDVAQQYGEQKVLDYIDAINLGVYT